MFVNTANQEFPDPSRHDGSHHRLGPTIRQIATRQVGGESLEKGRMGGSNRRSGLSQDHRRRQCGKRESVRLASENWDESTLYVCSRLVGTILSQRTARSVIIGVPTRDILRLPSTHINQPRGAAVENGTERRMTAANHGFSGSSTKPTKRFPRPH